MSASRWHKAGLVALCALGSAACANVIGLDAYQEGLGDAGGASHVDSGPLRPEGGPGAPDAGTPPPLPPGADAGPTAADAASACVPRAGSTELVDLGQTAPSWHTLHGGSTSIKMDGQSNVTCGSELEVTMNAGDWCGVSQIAPFPLMTSAVHRLSFDVTTTTASTSQSIGIQVGADGHWCQSPFGTLPASTTTTVSVDPATMMTAADCLGTLPTDTATIGGLFIYLNGGGTYYIDDVLIE